MQRLCDKEHSWGENGLASLIPDMLLQGITGHPYGCPDMIGGGEYLNFQEMAQGTLDEELFVRHSEIACLMPAMQFSAAPYRVLGEEHFAAIKRSIAVRETYISYPVEELTDQFMLGDRYLVAPVYRKGGHGRELYLPKGVWERDGEEIISGGETIRVTSEYGVPVIYRYKSAIG